MDHTDTPDGEDQLALGKRKRTEENQELERTPSKDDASRMEIAEDEPYHVGQASSPTTKRLRLDGVNEVAPETEATFSPGSASTVLPPEILQHIFSFVDPVSLTRLMSVNRLTQALLDPRKPLPVSATRGRLRLRDQNDIWSISRRAFFSAFPRPMEDMSELEMWTLTRGLSCQFCRKKPKGKAPLVASSPWSSGPGPEGVRAIWSFRVRACASCLEARLVKDSELLLSSSSVLMPGLPFAVFTPSLNYVTSYTLRQMQPPPRLSLNKYYFRPQIQAMEAQMAQARSLGQAATEEWYKGLEQRGQSETADAARFEQWESSTASQVQIDSGSARRLSTSASTSPSATSPAYSMISSGVYSNQLSSRSPRPLSNISTPQYSGTQPASVFGSSTPAHVPFQSLSMIAGHQSPEYHQFTGGYSPASAAIPSGVSTSVRLKPERNFQEIIRMKAERRAEIERRCLALDPPIRASTLTYMDAFTAAVQIPMLLNDNAWDVLKSRLLAQRAEAEQKEAEQTTVAAVAETDVETHPKEKNQQQPVEAGVEHMWEEIQKPARDKIKTYAEDYIKSIWADGRAINKATSGKFAADVLQHVRRRFYDVAVEEDKTLAAHQMIIPHDSSLHDMRKLRLEDMKWIFEEVIRPHTERFGREIFICSTCDAGAKRFSFDAVIQHYAAKHTSELSRGNAVVYWKADWPAEPPFHPSPDTVWHREPEHRMGLNAHYAGSQYATSPPYFPNPGPSWMSPMHVPLGQPNGLYNVQCEELVSTALQIWDATDEIRGLPDSVRLYVIVQHVSMRLSQKFTNEPPLSMFTDCICHKTALRALKDLHGLQCKSCRAFGESTGRTPFQQERPLYDTSELFEHFQRTHVELDPRTPQRNLARPLSLSTMDAPRMDWKFDMIELPDESIIRNLMYSPGINLQKLQTISSVLPHYFPVPLPPIEPLPFDAGRSSRPPSNPDRPRHDGRFDEGRAYGVAGPRNGTAAQYGEIRYEGSYDRSNQLSTHHGQQYFAESHHEPRRYIEVLPPRDVVYVERPSHELSRVDYMPPSDRYEFTRRDDRVLEELPFVSRGRSNQRGIDNVTYVRTGPRYSPVVDDSPRPHTSEAANLDPSDVRMRDRADTRSPVKEELHPLSPHHHDVLSATENFLQNFDAIGASRSTGNTPRQSVHDATSPPRLSSSTRLGELGRSPHVGTPSRTRHIEDGAVSRSSGSRRRTPPPIASQRRSPDGSSTAPVDDFGGTPLRASAHPDIDMLEQRDYPPTTAQRDTLLDDRDQSTWSRRNVGYIRRPPPDDSRRSMDHPYEPHRTAHSLIADRNTQSREPPSPELQYRRYEELPKRYIEILPNGEQRIIEEYPAPSHAPVEYIQPAPRDYRNIDRRSYYADVPPQQREREIRYVDQYERGARDRYHPLESMDDRRYSSRPYSRHGSDEPRR